MTKEEIQKNVQRRPFVPFNVRLASGEEINVPTADHANLHPRGRTLFVHLDEGGTEIIDVTLVTQETSRDFRRGDQRTGSRII